MQLFTLWPVSLLLLKLTLNNHAHNIINTPLKAPFTSRILIGKSNTFAVYPRIVSSTSPNPSLCSLQRLLDMYRHFGAWEKCLLNECNTSGFCAASRLIKCSRATANQLKNNWPRSRLPKKGLPMSRAGWETYGL